MRFQVRVSDLAVIFLVCVLGNENTPCPISKQTTHPEAFHVAFASPPGSGCMDGGGAAGVVGGRGLVCVLRKGMHLCVDVLYVWVYMRRGGRQVQLRLQSLNRSRVLRGQRSKGQSLPGLRS